MWNVMLGRGVGVGGRGFGVERDEHASVGTKKKATSKHVVSQMLYIHTLSIFFFLSFFFAAVERAHLSRARPRRCFSLSSFFASVYYFPFFLFRGCMPRSFSEREINFISRRASGEGIDFVFFFIKIIQRVRLRKNPIHFQSIISGAQHNVARESSAHYIKIPRAQ